MYIIVHKSFKYFIGANTNGADMLLKKLKISLNPYQMYSLINREHSHSFLLESMEGDEKLARFSFIGFDPEKIITAKGKVVNVDGQEQIHTQDLEVQPLLARQHHVFVVCHWVRGQALRSHI